MHHASGEGGLFLFGTGVFLMWFFWIFLIAFLAAGQSSSELEMAGRIAEAEALTRSLLERPGLTAAEKAAIFNELGRICAVNSRYDDAERWFKRSIRLMKQEGLSKEIIARVTLNLASVYVEAGRVADARRLKLDEQSKFLTNPVDIYQARTMKAALALASGRLEEAERGYLELVRTSAPGEGVYAKIELATMLNNLGTIRLKRGDAAGSQEWFRRSAEAWRSCTGPLHPSLIKTLFNLGVAELRAGQYVEAAAQLEEARELSRQSVGEADGITVAIGLVLADALNKSGRREEARQVKRQSEQARATIPVPMSHQTVDVSDLLPARSR
jgi:tetratricopeptide (TPR) repeat protein